MNRELVKQQIQLHTVDELKEWRDHAVKCLHYYLKYRDEFEIEECHFVISQIDKRLSEWKGKDDNIHE